MTNAKRMIVIRTLTGDKVAMTQRQHRNQVTLKQFLKIKRRK